MKQYIKFFDKTDRGTEEFIYHPGISGKIELYPLTNSVTILKLYFRKLSALNKPVRLFDGGTELMLTNFPVAINNYDELNSFVIELKHGWYDEVLFTMLSLQDGEPVNNNIITFQKNDDGSFWVNWKGEYTYYHSENGSRFEMNIIVYPETSVVTPLCDNDDELKELFGNKTADDLIPYSRATIDFDDDDYDED